MSRGCWTDHALRKPFWINALDDQFPRRTWLRQKRVLR